MKLELTLKVEYLADWDAYCGVRELLQNAKDAQVEFNATLDVRHRKDTKTLVIENEGCTLPHEALLFGHTTKRERSDLIGKFGEGLKLGVLALVRAGHPVKIRSGSEVWIPSIQKSEKFNADVLVFEIEKGRADKARVQIEVGGIDEETWVQMKSCFLFLSSPKELDKFCVETSYGRLLVGEAYAGKIFVKGIFVQNDSQLRYGYDFDDATIDRDRKMVEKWDMQYKCKSIWSEAANKRPDLIEVYIQMLDQQASDLEGVDSYSAQYIPQKVKDAVVGAFQARHGEDAVPVQNLAESKNIEHLGRKGVVVAKGMKAVLSSMLGTVEQIKSNLGEEILRSYSWGDLDGTSKKHLQQALDLLNKVESFPLDLVDIVDFRDEKIRGMYKDGRVLLSAKDLESRSQTLWTLVHEVAHHKSKGGDGEVDHVRAIETIWSRITECLLGPETSESN